MTDAAPPQRFDIALGDGVMAGWRWPAAGKPPLLFCHATGFCASVYKSMLGRLAGDFDVVALDLRGHGRTTLSADPADLRSWRIHAKDVAAFLDSEARAGWTLSGHSMGSIVSLLAADGRDDIAALRLIEPVLPPAWMSAAAATPLWPLMARRIPMVERARRRRNGWPDRETAIAGYRRRAVFSAWAEGVLEDYLEDGLCECEGGVALSCAPDWEAATFAAQANPSWATLARRRAPTSMFLADDGGSTVSPSARTVLARMGVRVTIGLGVSHLAPMERPDLCAAFIAASDKPHSR